VTATGKAVRYPRSFGTAWRDGLPGLPVVVGLSGTLGELTRSATEITSAGFEIVRIGHTAPSCSVDWRVEGTGGFPVLPEHFVGGVYPEGVAAFAPTATVVPGTISLAAGAAPPTALTGRVVLFSPDKCRIAEGHAELLFSIAAAAPETVVVTLAVPFDVLTRDPAAPTIHTFHVLRSAEDDADLADTSQISWRVEGTGPVPLTGAMFAGGVLPTGVVSFATTETSQDASFTVAAGESPLLEQTGQLLLFAPVDCGIDPNGETYALHIPAKAIPISEWDFTPANMTVQPAPGDAARVTFSSPGGVPQVAVAGAANTDAHNVALWFKAQPFQNYEITFEYEKNEDTPAVDTGGRFAQVWGAILGTTGGRDPDVNAWTAGQWNLAGDADYGDYSRSWRVSFDTDSTNVDNKDEARIVLYDEGVATRPESVGSNPNFTMAGVGSKYQLTLRRESTTVTILKAAPGAQSVQWNHPDANYPGRLGFRFGRGRGGILRPVSGVPFIRDLTSNPPPPGGSLFDPIPLAELPPSRRTNVSGAAVYAGVAGQNFVLSGNITNEQLTVRGTGSKGMEIVLRGDRDANDRNLLPLLTNCTIRLEGRFCCLSRVEMSNCVIIFANDDCSVSRCSYSNRPGYLGSGWIRQENNAKRSSFHYNDVGNYRGAITNAMTFDGDNLTQLTKGAGADFHIQYNVIEKYSVPSGEPHGFMFWTGPSFKGANYIYDYHLNHNLILDCKLGGGGTICEWKSRGTKTYNNCLERCNDSFKMRNGEDCTFIDNLHIDMPDSDISIRGEHHLVLNNQWLSDSGAESGGAILCYAGNLHWDWDIAKDQRTPGGGGNMYASGYCQVGGNHAKVYSKWSQDDVKNHIYEATGHNIGPDNTNSRNRVTDLSGPFDKTTRNNVAGADYNKILTRYQRAKWGMRYTP